jgi:hypothetical protein
MRRSARTAMSAVQSASFDGVNPGWGRWLAVLVALIVCPMALLYLCVLLIDPFSTGRFTPIQRIDVATRNVTLGHPGRARDLTYDAGIFGNSHAALFDPERLGQQAGRRFAQFSGLGYGPVEQVAVARAFVRQRRGRAPLLLFVLDEMSCGSKAQAARFGDSFPAFLFQNSAVEYLRGIFVPEAIKAAGYRVLMLAGFAKDRKQRNGYDVEAVAKTDVPSAWSLADLKSSVRPSRKATSEWPPGALELMRGLFSELDDDSPLVLYFSRLPIVRLPVPGSPADEHLSKCTAAYHAIATARPRSVLINHMVDDAFARDLGNFWDSNHVRSGLAPLLEREIADAIVRMATR